MRLGNCYGRGKPGVCCLGRLVTVEGNCPALSHCERAIQTFSSPGFDGSAFRKVNIINADALAIRSVTTNGIVK